MGSKLQIFGRKRETQIRTVASLEVKPAAHDGNLVGGHSVNCASSLRKVPDLDIVPAFRRRNAKQHGTRIRGYSNAANPIELEAVFDCHFASGSVLAHGASLGSGCDAGKGGKNNRFVHVESAEMASV